MDRTRLALTISLCGCTASWKIPTDIISLIINSHINKSKHRPNQRQHHPRQQKITTRKNRALIGKTIDVLIDGTGTLEDGTGRNLPIFAGRTYRQAPEVDGMVFVKAPKGRELAIGDVIKARVTESTEYDLWGKAI